MKNIISVCLLDRSKINEIVTSKSGIYRWWFDDESTSFILSRLNIPQATPKLLSRTLDNKIYYALYFGISKNLRGRIKWHALQKHTTSAIKSSALSTLRKTLSALLNKDMSEAEDAVNDFIKQHCYWEWEENETPNIIEEKELSTSYYPLNIQKNKMLPKEVIKRLKEMRKNHKK